MALAPRERRSGTEYLSPMSSFSKVYIQYVFLDVVAFTRSDRTVEDMVAIIESLNDTVRDVLDESTVQDDDIILLPTGDGMCIALLHQQAEDTHLEIAELIRSQVEHRRKNTREEGQKYHLHIAVHESKDILIRDINDRRNIIGAGINKASRLMDRCGPGEIVISSTVYDGIYKYARYKGAFVKDEFKDKAGELIHYYRSAPEDAGREIGKRFREVISLMNHTIGPALTHDDIATLKEGDMVYHKVYGMGELLTVGAARPGRPGRPVTIKFPSRSHSVVLTNSKGNYSKVSAKEVKSPLSGASDHAHA
jgi:class 3 adenylate cyclase